MRKLIYVCIVLIAFCTSCFDDESNLDIKELNPIRIENIDLRKNFFSLFMGDTLRIEPLVFCEGIPDSELAYEWQLSGGTIVPTVIDSTMYLCAEITAPPYSTGGGYFLKFTITDKTTGISRIEPFYVEVLSPYGEGILIADTKDDGLHSDISLVMSREVSSSITSTNSKINIFRNLWSKNNGAPLDGRVLDAITSIYGTNRSLTVVTTEHIQRADNIDFIDIPNETDELLFTVVPPHIGHGYSNGFFAKYTSTGDEVLCADGMLTARGVQHNNRVFGYTLYPSGISKYNVTLMYAPKYNPVYTYDALSKQMLFYDYNGYRRALEQNSSSLFDVRNLQDYEPFYLAEMSSGVTLLTKQISTGKYKALVMVKGSNTTNYAKSIYDFSAATNIHNAKYFELNQLEDAVYYATDEEVYVTPMASINAQVQWRVPAGSGDKITGIKIYKWSGGQCRYPNGQDGESFVSSVNRMLMITTYNEATKEGKVTLVPIVTLGVGGLEQNQEYHVVLSGFGKILGIYKQNK